MFCQPSAVIQIDHAMSVLRYLIPSPRVVALVGVLLTTFGRVPTVWGSGPSEGTAKSPAVRAAATLGFTHGVRGQVSMF